MVNMVVKQNFLLCLLDEWLWADISLLQDKPWTCIAPPYSLTLSRNIPFTNIIYLYYLIYWCQRQTSKQFCIYLLHLHMRSPPEEPHLAWRVVLFLGWLLMSLLSFYHVQLGWDINMLVSELGGVNWSEKLTIYGPWPDSWPLKFWP